MTVEWTEWSDAEATTSWDRTLVRLPEHSIYQSFGWGEYKRRHGWRVVRGGVVVDGAQVALAQCLVREVRLPRVAVVWIPGGPAGDAAGCSRLPAALGRRYRGWRLYVRAHIVAERAQDDDRRMRAAGWWAAPGRIGAAVTFRLDVTAEERARRRALHGNWRHNLVRGEARGGEFRVLDAAEPLEAAYAVYGEATGLKRIASTLTLDDLRAWRELFGKDFSLAITVGKEGAPEAVRGFLRVGRRAYDMIAGVTAAGRRSYAGYVATWGLLEAAHRQGVEQYDMSGADAENARGVYDFKQGLGGRAVPMLGEWEWATSRWLRWALNRALATAVRA